jgi:hypothetical protein
VKHEALILAGGLFNAAFAVFHLSFWRLFRWKSELAKLTSMNRAVVQVLNLCLTFAFVIFAYVSFAHVPAMLTTDLGRSLLLLISLFWYLRAVEQIVFFGLRKPLSAAFFVAFVIGGSFYTVPLINA